MQPAAKILLFLLALPFLLFFFLFIIVPLVIILLFLSLFIPSIRLFHIFQTPHGEPSRSRQSPNPTDDSVDVECTVVNTTEETDSDGGPEHQELKP